MQKFKFSWKGLILILGLFLFNTGNIWSQPPGACDLFIPLADDLKAKPELEDFFKNNPESGVKSYDVLLGNPTLRKDKDALQAVNDYLDDTGTSPLDLKNEFNLAEDQTQFIDELGASLGKPNVNAVWNSVPTTRGRQIEESLIDGFNDGWPNNFPVIDGYDRATKTAISIKSIDLNAKTYQNLAALESRLMDYFRKLRDFTGAQRLDINIGGTDNPINNKLLKIATPRQPTPAEKLIFDKIVAASTGLIPPMTIQFVVF